MKITGMKIEGYKNISLVKLDLDSHMNLVSGKNGAGKSSLIEAMIDAIKGRSEMGKHPERKIKNGQSKAIIEVSLDDGENTLHIRRTITNKGVYLKAERADGKPVTQTDLDRLLDSSTINITKLLHLSPKEQIEFVKEIADIDTTELENQYKELYAERTVLNREAKKAKAAVESFGEVDKVEPVNISDLLKELEEADKKNRKVEQEEDEITDIEDAIASNEEMIEKAKGQIQYYKELIAKLKGDIKDLSEDNKEKTKELKQRRKKLPEKIDTTPIKQKISEAEETNSRAKKYEMYLQAKKASDEALAKVKAINDEMNKILKEREDVIRNSRLPFKNVEFDKDLGVVIGGIPFSEMSSAQQIRIMSRIYIESNPELKVIYIKDGSLLDPETLRQITEMSELSDYQFLVELVGEIDGSIIMREGAIADQDEIDEREILEWYNTIQKNI